MMRMLQLVSLINATTTMMLATRASGSSSASPFSTRIRTRAATQRQRGLCCAWVRHHHCDHRSMVTTSRRTRRKRLFGSSISGGGCCYGNDSSSRTFFPFIVRHRYRRFPSSLFVVGTSSSSTDSTLDDDKVVAAADDTNGSSIDDDYYPSDSILVGGDYAGLYATFDADTAASNNNNGSGVAKLIPVPEHFVPDSLVEWGQEPFALEVLVSEDITDNDNDDTENATLVNARHTITVLPETGCGIDNLLTMKSDEKFGDKVVALSGLDKSAESSPVISIARLIENSAKNVMTFESIFLEDDFDKNDDEARHPHRVRVQVDISTTTDMEQQHQQQPQILSPIRVYWERRVNSTSSHGTIADGGGLDGRTVSKMLGPRLRQMLGSSTLPPLAAAASATDADSITGNDNVNPNHVVHIPGGLTMVTFKSTSNDDDEEEDVLIVQVRYNARYAAGGCRGDTDSDASSSSTSKQQQRHMKRQVVQARIPISKFTTTVAAGDNTSGELEESASLLETWVEEE